MVRARHALRVHPLRSTGVVVGVPVTAAVAFGAHTVLGVLPLSEQYSAPPPSASPAPVPGLGFAAAPPPATPAPVSAPGAAGPVAPETGGMGTAGRGGVLPGSRPVASGESSGATAARRGPAAPRSPRPRTTVDAARRPPPSLMTFAPGRARAGAQAAPSRAAAASRAAAGSGAAGSGAAATPAAHRPTSPEQDAAPVTAKRATSTATTDDTPAEGPPAAEGGGSLLRADLGVAQVSVLSFGH